MKEIASNIIWMQNEIIQIKEKLKSLYLEKDLVETKLAKFNLDMDSAIPDNKTYYLPSIRAVVSKNALGMVRVSEVEILD